jgi:hypothetical protein
MQAGGWFADQLFGRVTENACEAFIDEEEIASI